jgi:hypothetical protein
VSEKLYVFTVYPVSNNWIYRVYETTLNRAKRKLWDELRKHMHHAVMKQLKKGEYEVRQWKA